ncbi:hypothetical protein V5O48_007701 [Marasmius crinis-equi]|uniref:F-box domain-containing protein n=1 Tax=Marasmius crinis-equi TaxID=585013 RepID=A0ABR3FG27_9AGAR
MTSTSPEKPPTPRSPLVVASDPPASSSAQQGNSANNPSWRCPDEIWEHIFSDLVESGGTFYGVVLASVRFYFLVLGHHLARVSWRDQDTFAKSADFYDRVLYDATTGKSNRLTVNTDIFLQTTELMLGSRTIPFPTTSTHPFDYIRMFNLITFFDNLSHLVIARVVFPLDRLFGWLACFKRLESVGLVDVCTSSFDWRISSSSIAQHAPYCRSIKTVEVQGYYSSHAQYSTLLPVLVLLTLPSVKAWKLDWTAFRISWIFITNHSIDDPSGRLYFVIPHHRSSANFPQEFCLPPDLSSVELLIAHTGSWLHAPIAEPDTAGLFVMEFLSHCSSSICRFRVDGWVSARYWSGFRIASPFLSDLAVPMHLTYILLPPYSPNLKKLSLLPLVYQDFEVALGITREIVRLPAVEVFQVAVVKATPVLFASIANMFPHLKTLYLYVSGDCLTKEGLLDLGCTFFRACRRMEVFHLYAPKNSSSSHYTEEDMASFVVEWGSIAAGLRELRLSVDRYYTRSAGISWFSVKERATGWELYNF